ncbi:MAG: hypothetical protein IIT91_03375 [Aeriscardovia sp.]|nr:hypothetical protein [Aeriscardovia sp.]
MRARFPASFTLEDLGVQFQYNPYGPLPKVEEAVQIEGVKDPKIRAASDKFEVSSPRRPKALGGRKEEAAALPHAL